MVAFFADSYDRGYFDHERRVIAWSTNNSRISVRATSGATLLQRRFSTMALIAAVSINSANVVAVAATRKSAAASTEPASLFFIAGNVILHTSSPQKYLTSSPANTQLVCVRVKGCDIAVVATAELFSMSVYCMQSQISFTLPLDSSVVALRAGPSSQDGYVAVLLSNGNVMLVDVQVANEARQPKLDIVYSVATNALNLRDVVFAGNELMWVATDDGRLVAYRRTVNDADDSVRLRFSAHPELLSLRRQPGGQHNVTMLAIPPHSVLWADENSLDVWCAACGSEGSGLDLALVSMSPNLDVTITATTIQSDTSNVLSVNARARRWDLLVRHPRRRTVERIDVDVPLQLTVEEDPRGATRGDDCSALAVRIAWVDESQLGILRESFETLLLEELSSPPQLSGTRKQDDESDLLAHLRRLVHLQHAALAFIKREIASTTGSLHQDQSIAHRFLHQLRQHYVRLTCRLYLVRKRLAAHQFTLLYDLLRLGDQKARRLNDMQSLRRQFHDSFGLQQHQEHPRDTLERWGTAEQPLSLCIEVLAKEWDVDIRSATIDDLLASAAAKKLPTPCLVFLLLIVGACQGSVPNTANEDGCPSRALQNENLEDDLVRALDVPCSWIPWAQLVATADLPLSTNADAVDAPLFSADSSQIPFLQQILSSVLDGLMCRGLYTAATCVCRMSMRTFSHASFPQGLGCKLLLVAYRSGNAPLLRLFAARTVGSYLGLISARALALTFLKSASSRAADALYAIDSPELQQVEAALHSSVQQDPRCATLVASLLCEVKMACMQYREAARIASSAAEAAAGSATNTEALHQFLAGLRASIDGCAAQTADSSAKNAQRRHSGDASPQVTIDTVVRRTDEELAHSVQQSGVHTEHRRGDPLLLGRNVASGGATAQPTQLRCERIVGKFGDACSHPQPCPYHRF